MVQVTIVAAATAIFLILLRELLRRGPWESIGLHVHFVFPNGRQGAIVLLAASVLFIFIAPPELDARPRPPQEQSGVQQEARGKTKKWPVKVLLAGSQQMKWTLEINQWTIALKQKKGPGQEIPISNVAEVTYDDSSHSKSRGWLHAAGEIDKTPLVLGVYPVAGPLVVAAFAAPFKTRAHFVSILWNDTEYGHQGVFLEIGKRDYASVLAELQNLTGKTWRDLPEERKKGLQDIQSGKVAK